MSYIALNGIVYRREIGKTIYARDTCDRCTLRANTGCEMINIYNIACRGAAFYTKPEQDSNEIVLAKLKGLTNV